MLRDHLVQTATIERRSTGRDAHGATTVTYTADATALECLVREMRPSSGPDQGRDGSRREVRIYFDSDPQIDRDCRIVVGDDTYEVVGQVDFNSLGRLFAVTATLVVD